MKQRKDARNHERSFALSARKVHRLAEVETTLATHHPARKHEFP